MSKNPFGFRSSLKSLLTGYVREKRICGYAFGGDAVSRLRELDRYLAAHARTPRCLGLDVYNGFVAGRGNEATGAQARRASTWRQFALFCRRQGRDAYVPARRDLPIQHDTHCPYIYTRGELAALFQAVERLPYRRCSPRRVPHYRLLFRLLYGTGLRLGEALRLTIGDLDRHAGVLLVSRGKNQKDRLLPLAPGLAARVAEHIDQYPGAPDTPLFLSPVRRHAIDQESVQHTFRCELLALAGLPSRVNRTGPRIHDLRHTFAVHRLEKWFLAGDDVEARLPCLSAYMGHTHLRDTYYYLRLTASFFPEIARRLEGRTAGVLLQGGRP